VYNDEQILFFILKKDAFEGFNIAAQGTLAWKVGKQVLVATADARSVPCLKRHNSKTAGTVYDPMIYVIFI